MSNAPPVGVDLRLSFPFGRYAATPWFRSRREHVGNVEWPPSPWRIARALVAVAARNQGAARLEGVAALVRALASEPPIYRLPVTRPLTYTQWMPRLNFGDALGSDERLDNGHSLLDIAPDQEATVRWPTVELDASQLALLASLLLDLPYLGQSVSVCEARLAAAGEPDHPDAELNAMAGDQPPLEEQRSRRLLSPTTTVTLEQLSIDTAWGAVRSMPAPPGSEWIDFLVDQPPPSEPARAQEPHATGVVLRLSGVLRPTVARPEDPRTDPPDVVMRRQLDSRLGHLSDLRLLDDDGDGRAERIAARFSAPRSLSQLRRVLEGFSLRQGDPDAPRIDCIVDVEELDWREPIAPRAETLIDEPVCFALRSNSPPLLADAITVAESFHRRLLGVAATRFGRAAIPSRLSGRRADGERLRDDHRHAHVLVGSRDGTTATHLMVWARGGFSPEEAEVVRLVTLPALCGSGITLRGVSDHPSLGFSQRWQNVTPFLPVRHSKRRGGQVVHGIEDQVRAELAHRGLPAPAVVRTPSRDWSAFRTVRARRDRSRPGLGAHAVQVDFAAPVAGPLALGANAHFSMGLFVPVSDEHGDR